MGKKRHEQRQEEKVSAIRERTIAMREKEKVRVCVCPPGPFCHLFFSSDKIFQATMDMFQQLAKQRYG